jgi:hypothetical protein
VNFYTSCPSCAAKVRARVDRVGHRVVCPLCGHGFVLAEKTYGTLDPLEDPPAEVSPSAAPPASIDPGEADVPEVLPEDPGGRDDTPAAPPRPAAPARYSVPPVIAVGGGAALLAACLLCGVVGLVGSVRLTRPPAEHPVAAPPAAQPEGPSAGPPATRTAPTDSTRTTPGGPGGGSRPRTSN